MFERPFATRFNHICADYLARAAMAASEAWRVMMYKYSIADTEVGHFASNCDYAPCRLVSKHDRRFFANIPGCNVARTYAACFDFDQRFARSDLGHGHLLYSDVV